jgi:hypothetical protein
MFTFDCTTHTRKQIIEPKISFATNNVPITIYRSIKPQNHPTPLKHVSKAFHIVLDEAQIVFVHFPTPIRNNYFPI